MEEKSAEGGEVASPALTSEDRNDEPFIIWTFRRTGGTTLRSIFFWLSRLPAWQDEGFNRDRELGHVTRRFEETGDRSALEDSVIEIVSQRKNLKHCIEVVPHEVTSSLLQHSAKAGYRHLILLRLNEVDRQLSLALAKVTSAWGPTEAERVYADIREGRRVLAPLNIGQIRRELDRDAAALGRIVRLMMFHRVQHEICFFENLYTGELSERVSEVRRIARYLGLSRADAVPDEAFYKALMTRSQGSKEIFEFIPNFAEAKSAIQDLTR